MNRTNDRKTAFEIIYTFPFNADKSPNELLNDYIIANDIDTLSDYVRNTVSGVFDNLTEIDKKIKENIKNRKFERLDNVCLTAMRLSVYEIFYNEDIPVSVAINEAIELTKLYDDSLSSFVHGNLGIIAKEIL